MKNKEYMNITNNLFENKISNEEELLITSNN